MQCAFSDGDFSLSLNNYTNIPFRNADLSYKSKEKESIKKKNLVKCSTKAEK